MIHGDRIGDGALQDESIAVLQRVNADGSLGPRVDYPSGHANGANAVAVDTLGGVRIGGSGETAFDVADSTLDFGTDGALYVIRHAPF